MVRLQGSKRDGIGRVWRAATASFLVTTMVVGSAWAQAPVAAPASGGPLPAAPPPPAPPSVAPPPTAPPSVAPPMTGTPMSAQPTAAQPPFGYPGTSPLVAVTFRARVEPLVIELYHPQAKPGIDGPIARCQIPCRAQLPVGRYKLYVTASEETLSGSRIIDIVGPSTVIVDPDAPGQRTTGLVLGIGGPVAVIVGAVVLVSSAFDRCYDCGDGNNNDSAGGVIGAVLLLGGLVAIPVGWTMFGRSFKPEVTQSPGAQVGLAPTLFSPPRGVAGERVPGLVLSGRF